MKTAGIDVSHKTVTVAIKRAGRIGKPREFKNTPQEHRALIRALRKAQVSRVGLEATGQYHLDLALALDDAGFALMVINPKAAKRFAEAIQTRTKTDAVDAAVLAEFAPRTPFQSWQRPDVLVLTIRACARRIAALCSSEQAANPDQKPAPCGSTHHPHAGLPPGYPAPDHRLPR